MSRWPADTTTGRHGEPPGRLPRTSAAEMVAGLASAAAEGRSVCIGYVDDSGNASERIVDPMRVSGGRLVAYDHRSGGVRTFALHRVTGTGTVDEVSTGT